VLVVRGVLAVVFGLIAMVWPGLTLLVLVLLFGSYVLVDGLFSIYSGAGTRGREVSWSMVAWGVVDVLVGIAVFVWPGITALVLVYLIAVWAIISGIAAIAGAIALRRRLAHEWAFVVAGVLSLAVGVILAVSPGTGAVSLVWLIAIYVILLGLALIAAGVRLRSWRRAVKA